MSIGCVCGWIRGGWGDVMIYIIGLLVLYLFGFCFKFLVYNK